MRRKSPEAFQGAIRYQNHMLANQYVIMINSLGSEAMYYLADRIQAISGVHDVIPTKAVDQTGRFYVLVDKAAEPKVRESLLKQFDLWYEEVVPEDAKPKEGKFEGIPGVGNPRADGYSSGDNSWLTTSTRSFMQFSVTSMTSTSTIGHVESTSLDGEERVANIDGITLDSSPTSKHMSGRKYSSYAAATATTVSDQVSGITESEQLRDVQHEELRNKIATLEAMIVQLCQQVQVLTDNSNSRSQQDLADESDYVQHNGKRQDTKEWTPRKHKKAQQYSAPPPKCRRSHYWAGANE
ncbi:hypothetical protein MHU86_14644 [Fragilaria crotonensis]|nr:hypothetical protein MHU86_14644 [Fragilaria crotonensis]